jgi:DNA-directed RNA polymerase subunit beta'
MDMTLKDIERVLYFEAFLVTDPGNTPLIKKQLLTEEMYYDALDEYGDDEFVAKMGAEAMQDVLAEMQLEKEAATLREDALNTKSQTKLKKINKRLKLVDSLIKSGNKPEWMVLNVLPILPPDLRPLVPLDGGRFATSDLNDLYRRVINRNNRLRRLLDLRAPEIIVKNEKRMLQEAVDSLLDNGRRGKVMTGANKRPLKSLADMIKGKGGRFRQNLLGKRVDYSGRSVIVTGPQLKLHQCGLPKKMALELFKPFIFNKLELLGLATTIKAAKKKVEEEGPEVWDILEDVIREHPVLLNRAPTLHRLGIQAFEPVLIEGKAIQLHPLVCAAFNADFDGDQMAVHLPLGPEAILEAQLLMLGSHNILNPANGSPITVPSQDMVLGLYYMTKSRKSSESIKLKGEGLTFYSPEEVNIAYNEKIVDLNAIIKCRIKTPESDDSYELIETTPGRVFFNEVVPEKAGFFNEVLTKKNLREIIGQILHVTSVPETAEFLDQIKDLGYSFAFKGGLSFSLGDIIIPEQKQHLINDANNQVDGIIGNYNMGLITNNERYNQVIDVWTSANATLTELAMKQISEDQQGFNSVYMMLDSGARGSKEQIRQLTGMRGLMAKPKKSNVGGGEIIENPILSNFKEGLSILEYFISTHGARKGLADTALKTADAGYLTRRLVDVSQDVIVNEFDCGTLRGIEVKPLKKNEEVVETLGERILGRVALNDIIDPSTNEILIEGGKLIDENTTAKIENTLITSVDVRSALTCETKRGICASCYGRNLATGKPVQIGEAVGVVAAQSIGEPGTQLTMRTFHIGGAVSRAASVSQIESKSSGTVRFTSTMRYVTNARNEKVVISRNSEFLIEDELGREKEKHKVPYGATLLVSDGSAIKAGSMMATWDPHTRPIISEYAGQVKFENVEEGITVAKQIDDVTGLSTLVVIESKAKAGTSKGVRPQIKLLDSKGEEVKLENSQNSVNVTFQLGYIITVNDNQEVKVGDVLARIPQETSKTRDITGGLPRVAELFEARAPKDAGILAEITGIVSFGKDTKGKQRLVITDDEGEAQEFLIPKDKHITVHDGQVVTQGEVIVDGPADPSDILRLQGREALARYIIDEVQDVYRLQGVKINDKHIEVIVRQMLRRVRIKDRGDTSFIPGEELERSEVLLANEAIIAENKQPAVFEYVLKGITKASLATDSFISAASFQETTRVLTEAAILGKRDELRGLKENVIVGRLIPAGTGMAHHENRKEAERLRQELDAKNAQPTSLEQAEAAFITDENIPTEEAEVTSESEASEDNSEIQPSTD